MPKMPVEVLRDPLVQLISHLNTQYDVQFNPLHFNVILWAW